MFPLVSPKGETKLWARHTPRALRAAPVSPGRLQKPGPMRRTTGPTCSWPHAGSLDSMGKMLRKSCEIQGKCLEIWVWYAKGLSWRFLEANVFWIGEKLDRHCSYKRRQNLEESAIPPHTTDSSPPKLHAVHSPRGYRFHFFYVALDKIHQSSWYWNGNQELWGTIRRRHPQKLKPSGWNYGKREMIKSIFFNPAECLFTFLVNQRKHQQTTSFSPICCPTSWKVCASSPHYMYYLGIMHDCTHIIYHTICHIIYHIILHVYIYYYYHYYYCYYYNYIIIYTQSYPWFSTCLPAKLSAALPLRRGQGVFSAL